MSVLAQLLYPIHHYILIKNLKILRNWHIPILRYFSYSKNLFLENLKKNNNCQTAGEDGNKKVW